MSLTRPVTGHRRQHHKPQLHCAKIEFFLKSPEESYGITAGRGQKHIITHQFK